MSEHEHSAVVDDDTTTYCAVHPDRETALRCNKCGRYMCVECAVQTPVGYRCRECVRAHDDKFFNDIQTDKYIALGVALGLSAVVAFIAQSLHLWLILLLIIAFPAGGAIGEAVHRAVSRRRGRQIGQFAAIGAALGGLLGGAAQMYFLLASRYDEVAQQFGQQAPPVPLDAVFQAVIKDWGLLLFVALLAFAVYGRFRVRI